MINRSEFLELQAFITVATQLNFRAAADTLGVSASAISHYVKALETRLSLRLLHRTTRSVALTNDGQALFQQAARPFADLKQALKVAQTRSAMVKGEIHLHAFLVGGRIIPGQRHTPFFVSVPGCAVTTYG